MKSTNPYLSNKFFEFDKNFYKFLGYIIIFGIIPSGIIGILGVLYDSYLLINISFILLFVFPILLVIVFIIYSIRIFRMSKEIKNNLSEEEQNLLLFQYLNRQMNFFNKLFKICLIITIVVWLFTIITGVFYLVDRFVSSTLIAMAIFITVLTFVFFWKYIERKLILKVKQQQK